MKRFVKTVWDCDYCNTKGIQGDVRECPNCGNPVGNDVKYYVPEQVIYVHESVVPAGPDWQCNYCGTYNRCSEHICENCGADKNGTKNYFGEKTNANVDCDTSADDICNEDKAEENRFEERINETVYEQNDCSNSKLYDSVTKVKEFVCSAAVIKSSIIIASIVALIIGIVFIFVPKEKNLTVDVTSWERSVTIEKYQTVAEDDWHLPSGARLKYSREEIHHYDQVIDGYKTETYTERVLDHYEDEVSYRDCGNGYAEEVRRSVPVYENVTKTREVPVYKDVPVYKTKYYYDIDKYVYDRTEKTQDANKSPYWPENLPVENPNPVIGNERVSNRTEKYFISAHIENKELEIKEYTMQKAEWDTINVGDTIKCKVYITNKIELVNNIDE